jgi:protein tyrosine phosphatase (PTP) superfamily phosphohydrolase (DUF442 family)
MTDPMNALRGMTNAARPLPQLLTGGQPTEAQLEALSGAGGAVVIDIRDPMEPRPFDERATVERLGMKYVNVPVSPGNTGDAAMEKILGALRESAGSTVLLHCASGNRTGAPLIAHLMLDHGVTEEEAVARAMQGGLRSPEYLEWGVGFARSRGQGTDGGR